MSMLLSAQLTPKEVEKLISVADDGSQGVTKDSFQIKESNFEIKGSFQVDLTHAGPTYNLGKLSYGPVTAQLRIDEFWIEIDWHRVLGIPKKVCLTIKDPCGHVIIDECVHFDLGVTKLKLFQGTLPISKFSPEILDVTFVDGGSEAFDLKGDIPFAGLLSEIFMVGIRRAALEALGGLIQKLLESVIGTSWVADQIIGIVKSVFKIVDKAAGLVAEILKTALKPLDELLHKLFKDKLEIGLKKAAFPKRLTVMKAAGSRPPVAIDIATPPIADLKENGLYVEILQ